MVSRASNRSVNSEIHREFFGHKHVTVIEPNNKWFNFRLREVWAYRDLIYLFVHRDFVAQYKQTILGPLWHFIQPLLTTVIFTIVFGKIAQLSTDGLPPFLFYMAGTVIWTYFATVMTDISYSFIKNVNIYNKVYFPRLVIPISALVSRLIAFSIQFLFFLFFIAWFTWQGADIRFNVWVLLTPVLLIMMAALALGIGVMVSALTTRYRDLNVLVGFGVQLLMYASPVIYPLSSLPAKWQNWALFNPAAPIIETFRYAYLGSGTVSLINLVYSAIIILVIFILGILLFNRVERTFVDTV